ncbi:MAG: N-6 DNA methylase, partial [Deltaproteobacteria bacterium]
LQNLFFATLNTEMNRDNPGSRRFIGEVEINGVNPDYNDFTVYRHKKLFRDPEAALKLFEEIPFLNGGLFECLDTVETGAGKNREIRYDGFSTKAKNQPVVPDTLFFGEIKDVDLSQEFGGGNSGKHETVTGLIDILSSYKFTIAENTLLEEEVALDPELLGKVFENLLASYNPETRNTARNQTGSFYTPREIVHYMVDESLKAYLADVIAAAVAGTGFKPAPAPAPSTATAPDPDPAPAPADDKLFALFSHTDTGNPFADDEEITDHLIKAISNARILDLACGSGAFPMGVLHRMVHILGKLDPNNRKWKQAQLDIVEEDRKKALEMRDEAVREGALKSVEVRRDYIEASFESSHHELDYLRKLFLIGNCIYGVDIQNIAVQIAKLRFFISLIVEQKKDPAKPNLGILAMPNLETKFVAADSLIALERPQQIALGSDVVEKAEFEVRQVRERSFYARKYKDKKELKKQEKVKREALEKSLLESHWGKETAHQVAAWNPFDVSGSAPFFDPEMMFCLDGGFNIVIGNPPYIQIQSFSGQPVQKQWEAQKYATYAKTGDVYCLFYERGFILLAQGGTLAYISSNQWMRTNYGQKLREFFATVTAPQTLIDFGDHQVFESATVNTNILVIRKQELNESRNPLLAVRIENDFKADTGLAEYLLKKAVPLTDLSAESWIISSGPEYAVRKRIEEVGVPLKKWDIALNYGIKTGKDEAFIITDAKKDELITRDPKSAEIIKPLLRGRDIKRYKTEYADLWLINSHNGYENIPRIDVRKDYPAIWEHLQRVNKETEGAVEKRQDQGAHWTNLRNCAYMPNFEKEKICWGNLAVSAQFALVKVGMYVSAPSPLITPASKYLLAVLNSTLGDYYIRSLGVTRSGGFLEYKPMFVENLPIPKLSPTAQLTYECLVDCI